MIAVEISICDGRGLTFSVIKAEIDEFLFCIEFMLSSFLLYIFTTLLVVGEASPAVWPCSTVVGGALLLLFLALLSAL